MSRRRRNAEDVLKTTRHGDARMNQRGFTKDLVEVIRQFGSWDDRGRCRLTRHDLAAVIAKIDGLRGTMVRLLDKGGATVVLGDSEQLVTVYSEKADRTPRRRRHGARLDWMEA